MVSRAINTAYSTGGGANGLWRAIVQAVNDNSLNVTIPRLGQNNVYENVPYIGFTPQVGDRIWVGFIEGRSFEPVAFVGANNTSGDPAEADITEVIAGLGLSGGGDTGSVTIDFEPSELTTVTLAYDDKVVISDDSDSGEPKLVPISEVITTANGDGGEPIGHEDKSESVISFDYSTRTFTIAPVSDSYVVWCAGQKFVKTDSESVVIGSSSDLYYISFDAEGVLQATTTFYQWDSETPTAYIHYNSGEPAKYMLFDERHGIVLDWQTHEYLHRTRGAAIANGFDASNFDVSTQNGSTDDQAYIDIADGTFFDEDLQVDIVHSNTPTANTWEQDLQGPAQIPVFYQSGTTGWTYDAPTNFPLKYGGTPSPTYNLNSGGTWSTPEITSNNYGISWIVATNQLNYPVIAIMGQDYYTNVGDAEAVTWDSMNLDDLPVVELRVLYKVIYRASGSNTPGAYFVEVDDYRRALSSATSTAAAVVDHGNLTGLGDDDHTQYLLVDGSRDAVELTVTGDLVVDTDTLHVDATNDRVGIGTTSPAAALDVAATGADAVHLHGQVRIDGADPSRLTIGAKDSSNLWNLDNNNGTLRIFRENWAASGTGSSGSTKITITDDGDVAFDTDTLFVDATNDRVGINTTSVTAGHVLETRGAVLISSTAGVGNTHFPFTDGRFYYTADPETGGTGDHVFRHYSGGSYVEQMRILEGGKVGIGTNSPVAGLDIATTAGDTWTTNGWDSGLILNAASALRWRTANGVDWGIGNSGSTLYFMSSTSSTTGAAADYRMVINGSGQVGIGTTAPTAGYELDVIGDGRFSSSVYAQLHNSNSNQSRDKLRVWDSSPFTIGMKTGYSFGYLGGVTTGTDYAMSFQMSNNANRGWWWGDTGHTDAQGAMSLTTQGQLYVATRIHVGGGESRTDPLTTYNFVNSGTSYLYGNVSAPGIYNLTTVATTPYIHLSSGTYAYKLYRSTSTLASKRNIEELSDTYADLMLQSRPVWYQSAVETDDPGWSWLGLIAEEQAALDPHLANWQVREDWEGEEFEHLSMYPAEALEVSGVPYERLSVPLLLLCQRQQREIDDLQARLAALEAQ